MKPIVSLATLRISQHASGATTLQPQTMQKRLSRDSHIVATQLKHGADTAHATMQVSVTDATRITLMTLSLETFKVKIGVKSVQRIPHTAKNAMRIFQALTYTNSIIECSATISFLVRRLSSPKSLTLRIASPMKTPPACP